MREISSTQRLSELERHEPIIVLVNGTIESSYLAVEASKRFDHIVLMAVDFGALDRAYIADIAKALALELHIMDGREVLMKRRITPSALIGFRAGHDQPEHKNLCRAVMLDLVLQYANTNAYKCILHAASARSGAAQRMATAAYCWGFEGYFGNPLERSPIAFAQKKHELECFNIKPMSGMYLSAKSSFWAQEFEALESSDGDYDFSNRGFSEFDCVAMQADAHIQLSMLKGTFFAVNGDQANCIEITKRLHNFGLKLGLGRYAGEEFYRDNQGYLQLTSAPAAYLADLAIAALSEQCMTERDRALRTKLNQQWFRAIDSGHWFGDAYDNLRSAIHDNASVMSGHVDLEFFAGSLMTVRLSELDNDVQLLESHARRA